MHGIPKSTTEDQISGHVMIGFNGGTPRYINQCTARGIY